MRARLRLTLQDLRDVTTVALRSGMLRGARPAGTSRLIAGALMGRRDPYLMLSVQAATRPDAVGVTDPLRSWTFGQLQDAVRRLAGYLRDSGVGAADRVGIVTENRAEHFVAAAAALRLGAVPAPISPYYPVRALADKLVGARVDAVVIEPALSGAAPALPDGRVVVLHPLPGEQAVERGTPWAAAVSHAPAAARFIRRLGSQPDVMLYTSGTTGVSKGANIQMRNARLGTAFRYLGGFDLRRGDVITTPCPLYHAAPMLLTGLAFTVGAHIVLRRKLDENTVVQDWLDHGVTHAFLVPTLIERLTRCPDVAQLRGGPFRALISGGAALRADRKRAITERLGPVLYDFYGATELGIVTLATPSDTAARPDSVGRVLPGVEAQVVDDRGQPVAPGEPGVLYVRSDTMSRYEGVAEDEDALSARGWSTAGDVATLDDSGYLCIVDRVKDMIVTGGVNVFPGEVEAVVERHPDVRECAVAGRDDEAWGEAVWAWLVLEDGVALDQDALLEHCKERLNKAQVPKGFTVLDAIPRNPSGKVLRRSLQGPTSL